MIFTVKMPHQALQECLALLRQELLRTVVVGLGGRAQSQHYCTYLWHGLTPRRPRADVTPAPVRVDFAAPGSAVESRARMTDFRDRCREQPGKEAVLLLLGQGRRAGRIEGAVYRDATFHALDRFQVLPADPLMELSGPIEATERERYSRVIGGLGTDVWGEPVWPRLRDTRWCLIGAGRGGTALAMLLARQGALYLSVVDPDRIEPHNLDGLPAPPDVVGNSKAQTLAFLLQRFRPEMTVHAVPHSVATLPGMEALWEADVILSAVDNLEARLVASAVATAYLKPHLDIGQSVRRAEGRDRELGADVRLMVPGQGCLHCVGGTDGLSLASALYLLIRPPEEQDRNFQQERAGSLASLASIAIGLGTRLMEDMLTGVREESSWLRLTQQGARIELDEMPIRTGRSCPVCTRTTGLGDDAPLVGRHAWGVQDGPAEEPQGR